MRLVFAFLLLAHSIAHLPGFLVAWRLFDFQELPYRTTILGASLDVGATGIRVVGAAWLLTSLALAGLAVAVAARGGHWQEVLPVVLAISTLLCVMGWPDARIGVIANLVLGMLLFAGMRAGVFGLSPWSAR